MITHADNRFSPDYAIHPGEILEETLLARRIKKAEFARRCGLSDKTISLIINQKEPVTPETAIKFERVLGISAALWNNLEALYRLHLAKLAAREVLERRLKWVSRFHVKELVKRKAIETPTSKVDTLEKILAFFGVGSIEALDERFNQMSVAYRCSPSFKSAPKAVAAWLRLGELYSEKIETNRFSKTKFRSALAKIRLLTTEEPDIYGPQMIELCKAAGVALVFLSELPKTRLSGAARWLADKPLIMLSLRHKTDDHLWFTFFHEAAHILYHGKKKSFIDEKGLAPEDADRLAEEKQANRFASNFLIPQREYSAFVDSDKYYENDIVAFAKSLKIAPGIVVGRLQHDDKIPFRWHNKLKCKLTLIEYR